MLDSSPTRPIPDADALRLQRHELTGDRLILIRYLEHKVASHDWHGVSDAANDLRVIEAQLEVLDCALKAS